MMSVYKCQPGISGLSLNLGPANPCKLTLPSSPYKYSSLFNLFVLA